MGCGKGWDWHGLGWFIQEVLLTTSSAISTRPAVVLFLAGGLVRFGQRPTRH